MKFYFWLFIIVQFFIIYQVFLNSSQRSGIRFPSTPNTAFRRVVAWKSILPHSAWEDFQIATQDNKSERIFRSGIPIATGNKKIRMIFVLGCRVLGIITVIYNIELLPWTKSIYLFYGKGATLICGFFILDSLYSSNKCQLVKFFYHG